MHRPFLQRVSSTISTAPDAIFAAAAFLLPLTLYLATTSVSITGYADSAELITAAANLDIAHPPGYPLFILLGKLMTLIPLGSVAFRVNLLSIIAAAATIALIYKIMRKFGLPKLSSLLGSLTIAVSYSFWLYAITAEVYALNNLLAAAIIYLTLHLSQTRAAGQIKQATRLLSLIAFLFGLALTNHLSILALAPGVLYLIWVVDRVTLLVRLPKLIGLFLLGLFPYAFLIVAAYTPHYPLFGLTPDPARIWAYLTRQDYGGLLSAGPTEMPTLEGFLGLTAYHFKLLATRLTPLAPLFALYFIAVSLLQRQPLFVFFSILLATTAIVFPLFALRGATAADLHSQGVIERFSILGQVVLGVVSLLSLYGILTHLTPKRKEPVFQALSAILIIGLIVLNYSSVNKRSFRLAENYARNILNQVEDASIIFSSDDMTVFSLLYLVRVERIKPQTVIINTNFLENISYQKELRSYWPDLYQTQSIYSYDVARSIIHQNQGKRPVYFVMLKDPYPLGFDGNPHYLTPMGLLLRADTATTRESLERLSLRNYWETYDLSDLEKDYQDPFAKLTTQNYAFRAQVNARVYLNAGCLACAERDIATLVKYTQDKTRLQEILDSLKPSEPQPPKRTAQDFLESAKQNLAKEGVGLFYFHRAVWDLEQALKLEPDNREAQAQLTELLRSIGL